MGRRGAAITEEHVDIPGGREQSAASTGRKRRRVLRAVLIGLVLLLVVAGVSLYVLTRPARLRGLIAGPLSEALAARVEIGSARIAWPRTLVLEDVQVLAPEYASPGDRLLGIDRATVELSLGQLLAGQPITAVALEEPVVHVVHDLDAGRLTLMRPWEDEDDAADGPLPPLPTVHVTGGQIVTGEIAGGVYRELGRVPLSGSLTRSGRDVYALALSLAEPGGDAEAGGLAETSIRGQLAPDGETYMLSLDAFAFESAQRALLPTPMRAWWDRLQPRGRLPSIRIGRDIQDGSAAFYVDLEFADVAVSYPHEGYTFAFTDLTGRCRLRGGDVSLDLTTQVEGMTLGIHGDVTDIAADPAFTMHVTLAGVLPVERPYEHALPPAVQKEFDRFGCSGPFDAKVDITRHADGQVTYTGTLDVHGANMVYRKFTYPVSDIRGTIHLGNERVWWRDVTGRGPTGARLTSGCDIVPPGDGAEVILHIEGADVPVDEALSAALDPDKAQFVDMFLHEPSWEALREQGLVQSSADQRRIRQALEDLAQARQPGRPVTPSEAAQAQELRAGLDRRVLDLGGHVDVVVDFHRQRGEEDVYTTDITADMAGMHLLFEHWPYPLAIASGQLVIKPPTYVGVKDVVLRGPTGARAHLEGELLPFGDSGRLVPKLEFEVMDMPIDAYLQASVPKPQDQWLAELGLAGTLEAGGTIFADEQGEADFWVDGRLRAGSVRPFEGKYDLTGLEGRFALQRGALDVQQLRGVHGESVVQAAARLLWQGDNPQASAHLLGQAVRWEDPWLDVIPRDLGQREQVAAALAKWDPRGAFDVEVRFRSSGEAPVVLLGDGAESAAPPPAESVAASGEAAETAGVQVQLAVRPTSLSVRRGETRVALERMTGSASLQGPVLTFDGLGGRFGQGLAGSLSVSGTTRLDGSERSDLTFSYRTPRIDETTRTLLPRKVLKAIDSVKLASGVTVTGRLEQGLAAGATDDADEVKAWQVQGTAEFSDASLDAGLPVTGMQAVVQVSARGQDGAEPAFDIAVDARELYVAKRRVAPLKARLATTERPGLIVVDPIEGSVYGGRLTGQGHLFTDDRTQYSVELTLHDAASRPLIEPPPAEAGVAPAQGSLSAALNLKGISGDSSSVRGVGDIRVQQPRLVHLPLAMTVLQLVNLTVPTSGSFDTASAKFRIEGQLIHIDRLGLRSPSLEVAGAGTLTLPEKTLDLTMYSRGGLGRILGPLRDMLNIVKDQLLQIRVTGTLSEPQTSVTALHDVTRGVQELFSAIPESEPVTGQAGGSVAE